MEWGATTAARSRGILPIFLDNPESRPIGKNPDFDIIFVIIINY